MCIQPISLDTGRLMPPTPRGKQAAVGLDLCVNGKAATGHAKKATPLLDNAQMDQDEE